MQTSENTEPPIPCLPPDLPKPRVETVTTTMAEHVIDLTSPFHSLTRSPTSPYSLIVLNQPVNEKAYDTLSQHGTLPSSPSPQSSFPVPFCLSPIHTHLVSIIYSMRRCRCRPSPPTYSFAQWHCSPAT